jgi:hypothetical protein
MQNSEQMNANGCWLELRRLVALGGSRKSRLIRVAEYELCKVVSLGNVPSKCGIKRVSNL